MSIGTIAREGVQVGSVFRREHYDAFGASDLTKHAMRTIEMTRSDVAGGPNPEPGVPGGEEIALQPF